MKERVKNKTAKKTAGRALEIWVIRDAAQKSKGIERSISLAFPSDQDVPAEAGEERKENGKDSRRLSGERGPLILF